MPRKPRMYIPGLPCHVIQRGNIRDATFFSNVDYQFYLECLGEACERYIFSKLVDHPVKVTENKTQLFQFLWRY